jgi:hypothetical protein
MGFALGSGCLNVYIDPSVTPVITKRDPRWLGAWWLGENYWYNIYYNSNSNCTHVTGDWERESGQSWEPCAGTTRDSRLWWHLLPPFHAVIASLKNSVVISKIWARGICCFVHFVFSASPLLQLGPLCCVLLTSSLLLLQASPPKWVAYPGFTDYY